MPGLQDFAMQAAETIQTASINRNPSRRDMAPSTSMDKKERVVIDRSADATSDADDVDDDEIPVSILRPPPQDQWQKPTHLQLPDLRFEQSYLKSISQAKDWKAVAYVTIQDQVFMPLVQGMAWTLVVIWWKHWNGAAKLSGRGMGAKIRRWWWGVNNWTLPDNMMGTLRDEKAAAEVSEQYVGLANAGFD